MIAKEIVNSNLGYDDYLWEGVYRLTDRSILVCWDSGRGPCAGRVEYTVYNPMGDEIESFCMGYEIDCTFADFMEWVEDCYSPIVDKL